MVLGDLNVQARDESVHEGAEEMNDDLRIGRQLRTPLLVFPSCSSIPSIGRKHVALRKSYDGGKKDVRLKRMFCLFSYSLAD